jgi:hypothetical protein
VCDWKRWRDWTPLPARRQSHSSVWPHTSFVGEVSRDKARGEGDPWRGGGHRELTKRLREEGAGACLGDADVGARSGEGERGEGEETECPGEIGDCGRRRMGAAVMCRPRQARLRDTCREF